MSTPTRRIDEHFLSLLPKFEPQSHDDYIGEHRPEVVAERLAMAQEQDAHAVRRCRKERTRVVMAPRMRRHAPDWWQLMRWRSIMAYAVVTPMTLGLFALVMVGAAAISGCVPVDAAPPAPATTGPTPTPPPLSVSVADDGLAPVVAELLDIRGGSAL